MPITYTRRLTFFFLLAFPLLTRAQVNVTTGQNAQQLVNTLVGNNITTMNPVLTCPPGYSGEFQVVTSNLPISEGIVLSTGTVKSDPALGLIGIDGPYSNFTTNNDTEGPGDIDLDSIIFDQSNPLKVSHDACVLEFDFVPDVDSQSTLRFKYSFGSEEYNEYVCTNFNDVFAFLLTGPGITGKTNVALVPGTNIPVAINSINNGTPGTSGGQIGNCTAMGPGSPFPAYYIDNFTLQGQTVALDGFTVELEALATVNPCDTYHIKLAVGDVSDGAFNSAVFLQKNSFTVDTVKLDLAGVLSYDNGYLIEGCTPATITATRNVASSHRKKICLDFGGTAINGVDYPLLPDSLVIAPNATSASFVLNPIHDNIDEPGFETVVIRRLNCCTLEPIDSVTIQVRDSLKMALLSKDTSICGGSGVVTLHATGDPEYAYVWTPPANVVNPTDTLTTAMPTTTTVYTVTASYLGCPTVSRSFTAFVEPIPLVTISPRDTNFCIKDPYLLNAHVEPASFPNYTYIWTPATYLDNPSVMQPYFYTREPGTTTYTLTVNTPIGCTGSDTITITARPLPELIDVTKDFTAKYGDVVQLNANGATFYTWTPDRLLDYPNEKNPKANATDTATFQVIGTDQYGCRDTAYVHMNIDYAMFEMIPNAFSPNGDGRNDIFSIRNMKFQRLIEFRIFNRWGEEVYSSTDARGGWDGTYKGTPAEVGVYNYLIRITTPDGQQKMYKGDVSLIR